MTVPAFTVEFVLYGQPASIWFDIPRIYRNSDGKPMAGSINLVNGFTASVPIKAKNQDGVPMHVPSDTPVASADTAIVTAMLATDATGAVTGLMVRSVADGQTTVTVGAAPASDTITVTVQEATVSALELDAADATFSANT